MENFEFILVVIGFLIIALIALMPFWFPLLALHYIKNPTFTKGLILGLLIGPPLFLLDLWVVYLSLPPNHPITGPEPPFFSFSWGPWGTVMVLGFPTLLNALLLGIIYEIARKLRGQALRKKSNRTDN